VKNKPFEKLISIQTRQRDVKRAEFSDANHKVELLNRKAFDLKKNLDRSYSDRSKGSEGSFAPNLLLLHSDFDEGQKVRINRQNKTIKAASEEVMRLKEELIEEQKVLKSYEILQARRIEAWKRKMAKKETKRLDEVASAQFIKKVEDEH